MFEFCACSSDNCCVIAEGESGADACSGGAVVGVLELVVVVEEMEVVEEVVVVVVVVVGMAVVMVRVESEAESSLPGMKAEDEGERADPGRWTEERYIAGRKSNP